MIEPMCSRRDAASVIFNLPDYHVIDAVDLPSGGRRVIVQADTVADGCPDLTCTPQVNFVDSPAHRALSKRFGRPLRGTNARPELAAPDLHMFSALHAGRYLQRVPLT